MNPEVIGTTEHALERLTMDVNGRWFGTFTKLAALISAQDPIQNSHLEPSS